MFAICIIKTCTYSLTLVKMSPEPLTQECRYKGEVIWVGSNMDFGLPVGPHALVG